MFHYLSEKLEKLRRLKNVSDQTDRMIIFSLVLNAFYRLPEFFFFIHFYFFKVPESLSELQLYQTYLTMCDMYICELWLSISDFLYLLSYSFNIIFYFKFNKSFRDGFKNLFGLKK